MSKELLSLVAIVRDEAKNIRAMLDSCVGVVDRVVILDTGSVDNTVPEVRAWAEEHGLSGQTTLVQRPFVHYEPLADRNLIDFAATRNVALGLAGTDTVFTIFLSGDEQLHGGVELRAYLEAHREATDGAYCVEMQSGTGNWYYSRVLRSEAGWRYVFPRHELPTDKDGNTRGPIIPGAFIRHSVTDPERRLARMRDGDLPILAHIADDSNALPDWRRRAVVYLAQTEEAIADAYPRDNASPWASHQFAAMGYYSRRVAMGGDPDEINYAAWHYLNVASVLRLFNAQEMLDRLEPLTKSDPNRPEIWYMVARHAADIDIRRGLMLALRAADVAREAKTKPLHLPTDSRIEWLALLIACGCASEGGREREYIHELAARAIAAGGSPEVFEEFTS